MERVGTIACMKPNIEPGKSYMAIKTNTGTVEVNCSNDEFLGILKCDKLPEIDTLVKILEAPGHKLPRSIIPLNEGMIPSKVIGTNTPLEKTNTPVFKKTTPPRKSKGSNVKSIPKRLAKGLWRVVKRRFYLLFGKIIYLFILATIASLFLPGFAGAIWHGLTSFLKVVFYSLSGYFY